MEIDVWRKCALIIAFFSKRWLFSFGKENRNEIKVRSKRNGFNDLIIWNTQWIWI